VPSWYGSRDNHAVIRTCAAEPAGVSQVEVEILLEQIEARHRKPVSTRPSRRRIVRDSARNVEASFCMPARDKASRARTSRTGLRHPWFVEIVRCPSEERDDVVNDNLGADDARLMKRQHRHVRVCGQGAEG